GCLGFVLANCRRWTRGHEKQFAHGAPPMKRNRFGTKAFAWLACALLLLATAQAKEKKVPIGATPEGFTFKDIRYLPRTLDDFGQPKAFVIVFTTTGCPLVQRYLPRLKELSAQYRDQGAQFLAVNVGPDDSIKEVAY